ncbi:MAG TPA: type II toxin-antitoxin system VapC family toxin [Chryseosolibacter sp.]
MEEDFLIDTNVFINILAERYPEPIMQGLERIISVSFFISIINKIEILGFKDISRVEEKLFNKIINQGKIIHLHDGIVEETIFLRKHVNIKLPDAIIAASCISVNAVLLTSNTTDFRKISNLKVLNPLQLI